MRIIRIFIIKIFFFKIIIEDISDNEDINKKRYPIVGSTPE